MTSFWKLRVIIRMATSVTVQEKISAILPTRYGVLYRDVTNMQGATSNCKFFSARDFETNSSDGKWQSFLSLHTQGRFSDIGKHLARSLSFTHLHAHTHTHTHTHTQFVPSLT
jgi:hypothetical protein